MNTYRYIVLGHMYSVANIQWGWHASQTWVCTLVSNLVLAFVVIVVPVQMFSDYWWYCVVVEAVCIDLTIILAPVDTAAKRLTEKEKKSYKKL